MVRGDTKDRKGDKENNLASYAVDAHNKNYEFWKRDSLAVHLFSKEITYQKLDYGKDTASEVFLKISRNPFAVTILILGNSICFTLLKCAS